jgi:hypothetical protein
VSTAQELSALLANIREKVQSNTEERKQLAGSLRQIITEAQGLLSQIAAISEVPSRSISPESSQRRARGRPRGSKSKKRRVLSPEARERIRQAQIRRWANHKSASK